MKIVDLLREIFRNGPIPTNQGNIDYLISGELLELYKDLILETDEFSEVSNLRIINSPTVEEPNGEVRHCNSYLLYTNTQFPSNCVLYSMYLTPPIFDKDELFNLGTNNGSITPELYSEIDFRPYRGYYLKDSYNMSEKDKELSRERLHELLDDMIDNPMEYEVKGKRHIIIRGIFDNYINSNLQEKVFY